MKKFVLAALFAVSSVAFAQYPEMNDALDAEEVFELSQPLEWCDGREVPTTEWTCFARDARGGSLGVSTSFTRRDLAAGRAIESCRRKSSIPNTCAITRCNNKMQCVGDND